MITAIVVDDERNAREVLEKYIPWQEIGIDSVALFSSGLEALAELPRIRPDIILSDIRMPRMNGIKMAEQAQKLLPECKLIFLSGYADKEYLKAALKLKAVRYAEKPIDLDEIVEALKQAVAECQQERMDRVEKRNSLYKRACSLLTAAVPDVEQIESVLRLLKVDFARDSSYAAAILSLHEASEAELESRFQINEQICDLVRGQIIYMELRRSCLFFFSSQTELVFLFELDEDFMFPGLEDFLRSLTARIREMYPSLNAFIAVGQPVDGRGNISQSFQTAGVALRKCFFGEYNLIRQYRPDTRPAFIFDDSDLSVISASIRDHNTGELELYMKRLANEIRKCENTPLSYIRNIFIRISLLLLKVVEDRNITSLKEESEFLMILIMRAGTLTELEQIIHNLIASMLEYLDNKNDHDNIIKQITDYINAHYQDKELSIGLLAQKLHFTSTYLCILFKKATGKTINQYLTEVRISRAKDYLRRSDVKLYHIATKVGYSDANYFTKVFHRIVGMNPREYRESNTHA